MAWTIDFSKTARESLKRLDKPVRERIRKYVEQLKELPDPRVRGEQLKGNLAEFWKYRVGDYRLVCRISDGEFLILVVRIGHRREVYKFW